MSLEVVVTLPSRKESKLQNTPAAIHVLSAEDILNSAIVHLPDIFRLVPGMAVAGINSHTWAISSRGFHNEFSNKLQVLVDGRSVYLPLFSGTFWHLQDLMLENIDRVEVVRGPGAALYGSNAVNGILNIITKKVSSTEPAFVSMQVGQFEKPGFSFRTSSNLEEWGDFRFYGKTADTRPFDEETGGKGRDSWDMERFGFRMDRDISDTELLSVHGEIYNLDISDTAQLPFVPAPGTLKLTSRLPRLAENRGSYLLLNRSKTRKDGSGFNLRAYLDRYRLGGDYITLVQDTLDLEFQRSLSSRGRHTWIYGASYRLIRDHIPWGVNGLDLDPSQREEELISGFIQDEISLREGELELIISSKFEDHYFSGLSLQPSAKILYTPTDDLTYWASLSKAVRAPSRFERDGSLNLQSFSAPPALLPGLVKLDKGPPVKEEEMIAFEAGMKRRVRENLSIDLALFSFDYQDLVAVLPNSALPQAPTGAIPFPSLLVSSIHQNALEGKSQGGELSLEFFPSKGLKLRLGYSYLDMDLRAKSGFTVTPEIMALADGASPQNQFHLTLTKDLTEKRKLAVILRYTDDLKSQNIESCLGLDMQYRAKLSSDWDLSLIGRNLLGPEHLEFNPIASQRITYTPTIFSRTFTLQLSRTF